MSTSVPMNSPNHTECIGASLSVVPFAAAPGRVQKLIC
jgi:hypothetical protein